MGYVTFRPLRNLTDWFPAKYRCRRLTRHLVHEPVLVVGNQLQASAKALVPVQEMYTQISSQQDVVRSTMASQPQAAAILSHMVTAAERASGKKIESENDKWFDARIAAPSAGTCSRPSDHGW